MSNLINDPVSVIATNSAIYQILNYFSDLCFLGLSGRYVRLFTTPFEQPILTIKIVYAPFGRSPLCNGHGVANC